jgi:hypothetical protein
MLYHYVPNNAFYKLCLAGNIIGIHGCTPVNPMHALLLGILKYVMTGFCGDASPRRPGDQGRLAFIINDFLRLLRCTARAFFPRCDFTNGLTNLTLTTANKNSGAIFMLSLLWATETGRMLMKALKGHSVETLQSFRFTFQYLLVYQYWTKQEEFRPVKIENDGVSRRASTVAQEATIHMMDTVKKAYPRTESTPGQGGNDGASKGTQGWKLNKFHELLHIVRCIGMFGLPENWIASHGKRHHKDDCKRPAATAQKRHERFTKQVAERLVDQMVIEKAKGEYFLPVELNRSAQKVIAKRHAVNMFPGLVQNGQSISGLMTRFQEFRVGLLSHGTIIEAGAKVIFRVPCSRHRWLPLVSYISHVFAI